MHLLLYSSGDSHFIMPLLKFLNFNSQINFQSSSIKTSCHNGLMYLKYFLSIYSVSLTISFEINR